jgi:hypothetical protein
MAKSKAFKKLEDYLLQGPNEINLTFDGLERITESNISPCYLRGNTFLNNSSRYRQTAERVGFGITNFDLANRSITFTRGGETIRHTSSDNQNSSNYKPRIFFNKVAITDDDALKIAIKTLKELYNHSSATTGSLPNRRLTQNEIDEYFLNSDKTFLDPTSSLNDIQFIFKELAFHAQNGTNIEKIIKFINPSIQTHISRVTNNFNASIPLLNLSVYLSHPLYSGYSSNSIDVLRSYYNCLNEIRSFLHSCSNSVDVLTKLQNNPVTGNSAARPKDWYENFQHYISSRYGEPLTFDFLKEFGRSYNYNCLDFPKPDLHVKRTMIFIYNEARLIAPYLDATTGFSPEKTLTSFDAIDLHMELVEKASRALMNHGGRNYLKLKNYILDKAIYIVCSGLFYLPGHSNKKNRYPGIAYTKWLGNRGYRSMVLTASDIAWLDSFLGRI